MAGLAGAVLLVLLVAVVEWRLDAFARSPAAQADAVAMARWLLAVAGLAFVATLVAAAWILSGRLVLPLAALARDARDYRAERGDPFPADASGSPAEIVELRDVIRRMVDDAHAQAAQLRLFVDHAPVALAMFDDDMRYVAASRRWLQDYGLEGRELRGVSHYDVFPEIPAYWRAIHRRALAGEVLRNEHERFDRADGSVQWLRWEVRPWRDAGGAIRGIVVFSEDITDRQVAEQALEQRELDLQFALRAAELGVFGWDMATRRGAASGRGLALLGFEPGEPVELDRFLARVHQDDRERVRVALDEAIASGREFRAEFRIGSADGRQSWVASAGRVPDDGSGHLSSRVVGVLLDMTERRVHEERLRDSERRFRSTFEQAAVGIAHVAPDGRWLRVNERLCAIVGYTREEMLGLTFQDITHPADLDADLAQVGQLLAGRIETYGMEKRYIRKDGGVVWIQLTVSLVRHPDGEADYFISVVQDIDERKAMEEALQRGARQLERFNAELGRQVDARTAELLIKQSELQEAIATAETASRAKSEFLATMSHEIRTPMNAILGTVQVLERTPLGDDQRRLVHTIRSSGRVLLTLIDDVLDFSKIEAGRFELDPAPFVLRNVLSSLLDVLSAIARRKALAFELAPLPAGVDALVGDARRLGQVLYNLTGNAIKFTREGRVTVSVTLAERLRGPAGERVMLRFAVRDTGIGIARDKIDQLFGAFIQVDASTSREYGGTGLGLAISRQLVELMGGEIGVSSRLGEGSEFWFVLPFEVAESLSAAASNAVPGLQGPSAARLLSARLLGLRVLVVDDSPTNREVAARLLESEGAATDCANDGLQAVERLRDSPTGFDLVLMDVQMPVLDGLQATARIRTELGLGGLPVIALTAGALPSQRERALAAGMNDFIAKPFELDAMVATILRRAGDRRRVSAACLSASAPAPAAVPAQVPASVSGSLPPSASPPASDVFPPIPGIDLQAAKERFLGDGAFFLVALEALRAEFADVGAGIRADLAGDDVPGAIRRAHRLRGLSGNLAATGVAALAGDLEDALRRAPDATADLVDRLEAAVGALLATLPARLERRE